MPHHGSMEDPEIRRQLDRILSGLPGPTGRYPRGKYTERDEGEIVYRVAADAENRKVIVDFGSPVAWIGLDYDSAMAMSEALHAAAWKLRGIEGG